MKKIYLFGLLMGLLGFGNLQAETPPRKKQETPKSVKAPEPVSGPRRKELDFEEKIIEGLTGKDYTSLLQSGSADKDTRQKLYHKRADFEEETNQMLKELEYLK